MSLFMATHPSKTLFKPTASAGGSLSRSKACYRHDRASPEMLQTAANCCKLQVKTITKPTMSVLVAMCINASTPTFFSVASTMMKLCKVFYSDSIPDFEIQL